MLDLLGGVRVVDLSRLNTVTTTVLADLGADVIKVEEPPFGDYLRGLPPVLGDLGASLVYLTLNRNKRSVALDLGDERGREAFRRLVATADVVVENGRPGSAARRGLDAASLWAVKPDLVYCSVSGYGQTGPYAMLPSHGMNLDAAAGLLQVDRAPGRRPEIRVGSARGMELGAPHAAAAILAALIRRDRTGEGQLLDASSWDAGVSSNHAMVAAMNVGLDRYEDPLGAGGAGPRYNVYGTKDDRVLLICPLERKFWVTFCEVVGRTEWADRGTWAEAMDFGEDDPELRDDIEEVLRTRTAAEWLEAFVAAGVPVSPVLAPDELADDPHVAARAAVTEVAEGIRLPRGPVLAPGRAPLPERLAPTFGQHTAEVLDELGYAPEERAALLAVLSG